MAKAIKPDYYDDFSCIGGSCEDNCCKGWEIHLDKSYYFKYKNTRDPEFQKQVKENIKRNKKAESDFRYAFMKTDPDTHLCKFFDEDGLCSIQKRFGADYLSTTCMSFPRNQIYRYEDYFTFSMSTACPEVVRKAVLREKPIHIVESELTDNDYSTMKKVISAQYDYSSKIVNDACIKIMQYRGINIQTRIMVIGMLLKKMPEDITEETVSPVIKQYLNAMYKGSFDNLLNDVKRNDEIISLLESQIICKMFGYENDYMSSTKDIIIKNIDTQDIDEQDTVRYITIYHKIKPLFDTYWASFLKEKSYVLENYLVNYMLSKRFPYEYKYEISSFHHVIFLAEQYELFKILYSVNASENDGIVSDSAMTKIIVSISKFSQHSQTMNNIMETYIERQMDSLAHIAFMLMD